MGGGTVDRAYIGGGTSLCGHVTIQVRGGQETTLGGAGNHVGADCQGQGL